MTTYLPWRRVFVSTHPADERLVSKDLVASRVIERKLASKHSETQRHDFGGSRRPSRAANVGGNGVVIALLYGDVERICDNGGRMGVERWDAMTTVGDVMTTVDRSGDSAHNARHVQCNAISDIHRPS